jgi:hypothetical protein
MLPYKVACELVAEWLRYNGKRQLVALAGGAADRRRPDRAAEHRNTGRLKLQGVVRKIRGGVRKSILVKPRFKYQKGNNFIHFATAVAKWIKFST